MDESIEIMRRLWTEDRVTYQGKIFKIDNLGVGLKPLRKGGPPIWVAGGGRCRGQARGARSAMPG